MKIYLVRHGETEWNKEYRLQGQADTKLNDYGRELAVITSDALQKINFDKIFYSPLKRAEETARILKRDREIPLVADERLKEMNFGEKEGSHIPTIQQTPLDPLYNFLYKPGEYVPPHGGESFEDVYKRSKVFLEEMIVPMEKKSENVMIVAHGALNRTILNPIAGIPVENFWEIRLKNCAVSILDLTEGKFTIEQAGAIFYQSENRPKDILN